ncbi:MAG: YraN family protein [Acidimicrobiia bacterium]
MTEHRRRVGEAGERLAAAVLDSHGVRVVARNVAVDGGELDLLAVDHGRRLVVEVRTITGNGDPIEAYGPVKEAQVGRLARMIGAERVDLMAIRLKAEAAEIRWVKGAA